MKSNRIIKLLLIVFVLALLIVIPNTKSMAKSNRLSYVGIRTERVAPGNKVFLKINGAISDITAINVYLAGEGRYITRQVFDINTEAPYFYMPVEATQGSVWKIGVMVVSYSDNSTESYSSEIGEYLDMAGKNEIKVDYATLNVKNNEINAGDKVYVDLDIPMVHNPVFVTVWLKNENEIVNASLKDYGTNPYFVVEYTTHGTKVLPGEEYDLIGFSVGQYNESNQIEYLSYEYDNMPNGVGPDIIYYSNLLINGSNKIRIIDPTTTKVAQSLAIGAGNKKRGDHITVYKDGLKNIESLSSISLTYYDEDDVEDIIDIPLQDTSLVYSFSVPNNWQIGHTYKFDSMRFVYNNGNVIIYRVGEFLTLRTNPEIVVQENDINVNYKTHIENEGWENSLTWNGEISGTTGRALRLEGICIDLAKVNEIPGNIEYRTHIENIGWENNWKSNGQMSGTEGQALRLEAIQIRLTGLLADSYDVYYRVHAQNFGWLDWAKNGDSAGTQGFGYRLEAIQIMVIRKGDETPTNTAEPFKINRRVEYGTHIENIGWQELKQNGEMAGTEGQALRLEGIVISVLDLPYEGGITYRTHVENIGWQDWKSNGEMAGTEGQALRLEGIEIKLTGELAEHYSISYRTHVENIGWQDWKKDGEMAGTEGQALRLEGIQIKLVEK